MSRIFVALDFETANYSRKSACSLGMVRVESGQIVDRQVRLINPGTFFRRDFIEIHNITPEMVANEPAFGKVWSDMRPMLDGAEFLVAHNAPFDRAVLEACCREHRKRIPKQPFVCTLQAARRVWDIHPTGLDEVCRRLRIKLNHHEALSDATASAKIMIKALQKGYKVD